MKKIIISLATISCMFSFSCKLFERDMNSETRKFKCSFIGDNVDLDNFLLMKLKKDDDIRLQIFANQYMFLSRDESLVIYEFDNITDVFETLKPEDFSTRLKTDRKYMMHIFDSTNSSFKMKIISPNKTYSLMKNDSIIIHCKRY